MIIKQLSVFIENKEGRLETVTKVLAENDIDIKTISLADTTEFGMLRLIVSDCDLAKKVLKEAGFAVNLTDVVAVKSINSAGYLHKLLAALSSDITNIEYMYTLPSEDAPVLILKVSNPERIENILKAKNFA